MRHKNKILLGVAVVISFGVFVFQRGKVNTADPSKVTLTTPVSQASSITQATIVDFNLEVDGDIPELTIDVKDLKVVVDVGGNRQSVILRDKDLSGLIITTNLATFLPAKVATLIDANGKFLYDITPD